MDVARERASIGARIVGPMVACEQPARGRTRLTAVAGQCRESCAASMLGRVVDSLRLDDRVQCEVGEGPGGGLAKFGCRGR